MTRKEQIEAAAAKHRQYGKLLSPYEQDIFYDAALWADSTRTEAFRGAAHLFEQRCTQLESKLAIAVDALKLVQEVNNQFDSETWDIADKALAKIAETK